MTNETNKFNNDNSVERYQEALERNIKAVNERLVAEGKEPNYAPTISKTGATKEKFASTLGGAPTPPLLDSVLNYQNAISKAQASRPTSHPETAIPN